MKKLILSIVLAVGLTSLGSAQDLKTGIRFGVGESEFINDNGANADLAKKLSFSGGISAAYDFNEWFGLLGDVLLVNNGSKLKGQDDPRGVFGGDESFTNSYNFTYLEIPVLVSGKFKPGKFGVRAFAGPSINFMLKASYNKQYDDGNTNDSYGFVNEDFSNKIDGNRVGLIAGLGLDIDISAKGVFFADFRMGDFLNNLIDGVPETGNNSYSFNYYRISFGTRYTL